MNQRRAGLLCFFSLLLFSCAHSPVATNPYEAASLQERTTWKRVPLPFLPGTRFKISQGAFGKYTHHDKGHEYTWDFDVPYGTPVLAVDAGTVFQVWEPPLGGGCDPKYTDASHNIKVEAFDGTIAQYTHINSLVAKGEKVRRGQPIAVTAQNGYLCTPQLDFTIFKDREHTFLTGHPRDIPLLFEGLPEDGMAHEGYVGAVPAKTPRPTSCLKGSDHEPHKKLIGPFR